MAAYIIMLVMLAYESVIDIRERKIDIRAVLAAGITSMLVGVFFYERPVIFILYGIILGGVLIMLARISRQRIGYGDAIIFMVLGMCLEPVRVLGILWVSMLMAGVYGMIKIILFNKDRNLALPFIPFVTIVFSGMFILNVINGGI